MESLEQRHYPFQFDNPRQKKIFEDLGYIGPGPAAFYIDASRLMQDPDCLSSTSHLVGHLVREIESAMRDVLKPLAIEIPDREKEQEKKNNQEKEIIAIIQLLGIEDNHLVQAWKDLAKQAYRWAHRPALNPPRPVDEECKKFWEQAQRVFETSLAVRAVYGWRFPQLALLDFEWAKEHAALIFPLGEEDQAYFEAAWNSCVTYCGPYDNVFDLLRPQYLYAVQRVGAQKFSILP